MEPITNIPNAKSHVKGMMNLRGQIIPVIDVKERLGFGSSVSDSKQRILVVDINNSLTGLLVDEVDQVLRIKTTELHDAPENILESRNYVKGIAKNDNKLLILLDAAKLLEDSSFEIKQ